MVSKAEDLDYIRISTLMCPDSYDDINLFNGKTGNHANNLQISMIKCKGKDYCKSDAEIEEWLQSKLLLIAKLSTDYNTDAIGDETIEEKLNII